MTKSEKSTPSTAGTAVDIDVAESQTFPIQKKWLTKLSAWGIETRGIKPVPLEERTDPKFINVFFVWFTMSTNLLPYVYLQPVNLRGMNKTMELIQYRIIVLLRVWLERCRLASLCGIVPC